MKKRQWAIVGGIGVLALAILLNYILSNQQKETKPLKATSPKGVEVIEVKNATIPVLINIDGKLTASNRVDLFAEVNGVLQSGRKKFDEGVVYKKGETLLQLENSETRAAYLTAKNEYINVLTQTLPDLKLDYPGSFQLWYNYLKDVSSGTYISAPPRSDDTKLNLFLTGRGIYSAYQNLESIRVRLSKYTIKAPFNGIVTEAAIEPGMLVRAGQRIGEFIAPGTYELESTISLGELQLIKVGDSVKLGSRDSRESWVGIVYRTNAKIDPSTQRIKIFIKVKGESLRDGMFMNGTVEGRKVENAFKIARKLIYDEQYTFVIKDTILQRRKLDIIQKDPESVIARGLNNGERIPKQPIPGAFEGMPVRIIESK